MNNCITKDMIKEAYFRGVIRLMPSKEGVGTSFQVSDIPKSEDFAHCWAINSDYALHRSPISYIAHKTPYEIISEIYESLDYLSAKDLDYCFNVLKVKLLVYEDMDKRVEKLWNMLEDISFVEDKFGELLLDEDFYIWTKGTDRESIWYWFDEHFSKGVVSLLYPNSAAA